MSDHASKIVWFVLRTGASKEEAKKWLTEADWKIQNAVDAYRGRLQ